VGPKVADSYLTSQDDLLTGASEDRFAEETGKKALMPTVLCWSPNSTLRGFKEWKKKGHNLSLESRTNDLS